MQEEIIHCMTTQPRSLAGAVLLFSFYIAEHFDDPPFTLMILLSL